jgi:hypothetical protein
VQKLLLPKLSFVTYNNERSLQQIPLLACKMNVLPCFQTLKLMLNDSVRSPQNTKQLLHNSPNSYKQGEALAAAQEAEFSRDA